MVVGRSDAAGHRVCGYQIVQESVAAAAQFSGWLQLFGGEFEFVSGMGGIGSLKF